MTASSGSPTSYLPPQTTSNKAGSTPGAIGLALSGKVGGVSKKLILGLSSGLGVTVSLAIIAAIILSYNKRSRYRAVPKGEIVVVVATPDCSDDSHSAFLIEPAKARAQAMISEIKTSSYN